MSNQIPIIGVMGSGSEEWTDLSAPLGALIAGKNAHLLTGGGRGTMSAVSRSFTETPARRGLCIGVIPGEEDDSGMFRPKAGYPNPYVELEIHSPLGPFTGEDPHQISRNHINIMTSHAIVALPGSRGTCNECELAQKFSKPIILYGPRAAFTDFPGDLAQTEKLEDIASFLDNYLTQLSTEKQKAGAA